MPKLLRAPISHLVPLSLYTSLASRTTNYINWHTILSMSTIPRDSKKQTRIEEVILLKIRPGKQTTLQGTGGVVRVATGQVAVAGDTSVTRR